MPGLGIWEIVFILVLALLIFGPKKLPEIGRTLGRGLGEFRRASSDLKRTFDLEMREVEREPQERERKLATPEGSVSRVSGSQASGSRASGGEVEASVDGDPVEPASVDPAGAPSEVVSDERVSDETASDDGATAESIELAPAAQDAVPPEPSSDEDPPGSSFHRPAADPRGEDS